MRLIFQILYLFILITLSACSYRQLHYANNNDIDSILKKNYVIPEYVVVQNKTDSVLVTSTVKQYYSYKYNDIIGWDITPEGILLYLYNQGIKVIEAWYYPGANHTGPENGPLGKTMVPPHFIAVIDEDSSDLWRSCFELDDKFNPNKAAITKVSHFVFKGIIKAAPNQALKPTE